MDVNSHDAKVPAVGRTFWISKVVSAGLGSSLAFLISSIISRPASILLIIISWGVLLVSQIEIDRYYPKYYWMLELLSVILTTLLVDVSYEWSRSNLVVFLTASLLILAGLLADLKFKKSQIMQSEFNKGGEIIYWLIVGWGDFIGAFLGQGGSNNMVWIILLFLFIFTFFSKKGSSIFVFIGGNILARFAVVFINDYFAQEKIGDINYRLTLLWFLIFMVNFVYLVYHPRSKN